MDSATCIPDLPRRPYRRRGFTLIELLVVIAILVVVAGLIVGLAGVAGERKKVSRAQAERDRLVTLLENYRARLGVLPPDNTNDPGMNTLYYELAAAFRRTASPGSVGNPVYSTPLSTSVRSNVLYEAFGARGVINAVDIVGEDITEMKPILKTVRPDQTNSLFPGTISLTVPIDGPAGRNKPNPWRYLVGENAVHNKESFDLWVDIVVGNKTNTIGNWKD